MLLNLILGFLCAIAGAAALDEIGGALLGGIVGCLAGAVIHLKKRVAEMERRLELLRQRTLATSTTAFRPVETDAADVPSPDIPQPRRPAPIKAATPPPIPEPPAFEAKAAEDEPKGPPRPSSHETVERISGSVRSFFTTGNLVVKIGALVLFFGVGFLLKYAAERNMVSIELRLAGAAAGALAVLVLGWRLREKRRGYALTMQGIGVGVLYFVIFAASRLYGLFPLALCFFLMVGVVALSSALAVRQDALALAVFGASGGFLAPILTSSGGGSHVVLFSYYALLNAGIFAIAWFKAWRVLNLIGFFFTFGIGALWGADRYDPRFFASAEAFLVLFFLFYVVISVLFAFKQPPRLKGYVDGTLVFGLPIVAFALQSRLVKEIPHGLTFSALALGAFYILLAWVLWQRPRNGMRTLTEAFLALGVVFGTLAIPLALDDRWTAAAWALEGAALVWVGVRKNRLLARHFGVLLQIGAGVSFYSSLYWPTGVLPLLNGRFIGGMLVSLAGLFSAWYLEKHSEQLRNRERWLHAPLLAWGLLWWFGAGLSEIDRHVSVKFRHPAALAFGTASFAAMGGAFRRLGWRAIRFPAMAFPVVLWLAAMDIVFFRYKGHFFSGWGAPIWFAAMGVQYFLMRRFEPVWTGKVLRWSHVGVLLLVVLVAAHEVAWGAGRLTTTASTWAACAWCLVPGIVCLSLMKHGPRISWPCAQFGTDYLGTGPLILLAGMSLWQLWACGQAGDPRPLPYAPLLNPMDLSQLFGVMVMILWMIANRREEWLRLEKRWFWIMGVAAGLLAFCWLNAALARAIHFWGHVPYSDHAMFRSTLFQSAVSILWTVTAFGVMAWSARKQWRAVWFAGAGLLGLVVIKLFMVDLAGTGTVARIVSFLGVGVLMLVVGYVSPVPPAKATPKE